MITAIPTCNWKGPPASLSQETNRSMVAQTTYQQRPQSERKVHLARYAYWLETWVTQKICGWASSVRISNRRWVRGSWPFFTWSLSPFHTTPFCHWLYGEVLQCWRLPRVFLQRDLFLSVPQMNSEASCLCAVWNFVQQRNHSSIPSHPNLLSVPHSR